MAQQTYTKDGGVMVADESLERFLAARGWELQGSKPAKTNPAPRKRAAKKTAAPKQPASGLNPTTDAPRGDSTQEK